MPNPLRTLFFLSLFILSLAPPPLSAQPPPQPPSSPCKSTLYPKLCRSLLSAFQHSPASSDNYSKFSVKQSLKHARRLSDSILHFLANNTKGKSLMSYAEISALNDCHHLQELNADYLELISGELKTAENMSDVLVGRVQSLLSAVVTNQQTCYDGLADAGSGIATALAAPLGDAAAMYSASLGLVTHALGSGRRRRRGGGGMSGRRGAMELDWARLPTSVLFEILHESEESPKGRRLLGELDTDGGIRVNDTVTVSPYGGANFTSINDAIAFAPNNSAVEDGYFIIYAMQGYYEEYVVVPRHKKNIMLIGDGINSTVITGNRSVIDGWTTFNSATFVVSGERFVAMDITFQNTAGPEKHQAVAVRNNADLSTFYRCSFQGYQDTLYVHSLRQFYRECDIYGTVDFIFGNAAAVFQNCNLFARKPMANQKVAFTAQGRTDPNQNTGISIHNCTIEAAPDLAMDLNSSNLSMNYLGRPWKDYSRTVYMQSYIGSFINPVGWLEWNGTKGLDTLYYGEYENYGPGANTSMRVQWGGYSLMNVSEAFNFTVYNLTMGDTWLPETSIPFYAGLLQ
ncbi:putative pectinesterase/pectinesterase inhibitor 47 [Sesamum alatum]|uniref:Pectinesterase n=1 Tax=Sesamum alatum TaxID=300844 RepID=A0AAE2C9P0_9LAMI|nr:putative pectinesterase/pectinesterase inhibitor 47 [Sesamum alatum]